MLNLRNLNIQPLDIIFFSGTELISSIIKNTSGSYKAQEQSQTQEQKYKNINISHLAIVVNKEILPHIEQMESNKLYILESTVTLGGITSSSKICHGYSNGVQLRELYEATGYYCNPPRSYYEKICRYSRFSRHPRIYYRKLKNNPWNIEPDIVRGRMIKFYDYVIRHGYDFTFIPQISSVSNSLKQFGSRFAKYRSNKLYCSQIIAMLFQDLEIIDSFDSHITPIDFLKLNILEEPIEVSTDIYIDC